jgi:hypothetical protein
MDIPKLPAFESLQERRDREASEYRKRCFAPVALHSLRRGAAKRKRAHP